MEWKEWTDGQYYNIEEFKRLNSNYIALANLINIAYNASLSVDTIADSGYNTIPWQDWVQQMQTDLILIGELWNVSNRVINGFTASNINTWEQQGQRIEGALQAFNSDKKYCGYTVSGVEELWQI